MKILSALSANALPSRRRWRCDDNVDDGGDRDEDDERQCGGRNSSLVVCLTHCPAWCSVMGLILL